MIHKLCLVLLLCTTVALLPTPVHTHDPDWEIIAGYASSPPTIDGAFGTNEWDDATVIHLDPNDATYGDDWEVDTYIHVMSDNTHLYLCFDAVGDTINDYINDFVSFDFDTGNDETWTQGHEESFDLRGDGDKSILRAEDFGSKGCSSEECDFETYPGLEGAASNGTSPIPGGETSHMIYELQIPYTAFAAPVSPGDWLGFGGYDVPRDGMNTGHERSSTWPPNFSGVDFSTYGAIHLAPAVSVPELQPIYLILFIVPVVLIVTGIYGKKYAARRPNRKKL